MKTHYAKSGPYQIAYRVFGNNGPTLVLVHGWISNVEEIFELPGYASWIERLSRLYRVIIFDKAGVGLSDRVDDSEMPTLESRLDDLHSILELEGIEETYLLGYCEGAVIASMFAHKYRDKVKGLILWGSFAAMIQSESNPNGLSPDFALDSLLQFETNWGGPLGAELMAPSMSNDEFFLEKWASFLRKSSSPKSAKQLYKAVLETDISGLLPELDLPVLVFHRNQDRLIPIELGQELADMIPGSEFVELEGEDHLMWIGEQETFFSNLSGFVHGKPIFQTNEQALMLVTKQENLSESQNRAGFYLESGYEVLVFETAHMVKKYLDANGTEGVILIHNCSLSKRDYNGMIKSAKVQVLSKLCRDIEGKDPFISEEALLFFNSLGLYLKSQTLEIKTETKHFKLFAFGWQKKMASPLEALVVPGKISLEDLHVLSSVKDYLDENFMEEISLTQINRKFGLNLFKLKMGFKLFTGMPIGKYLLNLKLSYAKRLLTETDLSVNDIGYRLGYQQPSNFTKVFKQKIHVTPLEFRRLTSQSELMMVS